MPEISMPNKLTRGVTFTAARRLFGADFRLLSLNAPRAYPGINTPNGRGGGRQHSMVVMMLSGLSDYPDGISNSPHLKKHGV